MKILLVDDDALVIRLLKSSLGPGYQTLSASSAKDALKLMGEKPSLAIVDLDLEERLLGLTLISPLKKIGAKVVVVSSHEEEELIDSCYEAGCDLFYSKGDIVNSIHQIINDLLLKDLPQLEDEVFNEKFITSDKKLIDDVKRAFRGLMQSSNVLITGETGTGKSELAKLFHRESKVSGEFVALNCAGLARELLESELFGHTKGAFTGADRAKIGKIKFADNGVLFLDEINSMSLDMQAKLLKAVEEKKFYPVGSERMVESSFKLIAASNENLFQMVAEGRFRLDLLQRLCGTMIDLAPLRQRQPDVFLLMKHFNQSQRRLFLVPEVKEMISNYDWKGNTREVKRFCEFCLSLEGGRVLVPHFQEFTRLSQCESPQKQNDLTYWIKESLSKGLDQVTDDFRKTIIDELMKSRGLNVTSAIKELKISTRQFYKHMGQKKKQPLDEEIMTEGDVYEQQLQ